MKKRLVKLFTFALVTLFLLQIPAAAHASWYLQRFQDQYQNTTPVSPKLEYPTPKPSNPTNPKPTPSPKPGDNSNSGSNSGELNNQSIADLIRNMRKGNQPPQNGNNSPSPDTPAPAPEPKPDNPDSGNVPSNNNLETQLLDLVNNERSKNGLKPLQWHSGLASLARAKSDDMVKNNYFSHNSPTFGSFFQMVHNAGIPFRQVGENLAMSKNVQTAFYQFMGSKGHRDNILSPHFTHIGIGIVPNQYGITVTQLFIAQ